MKSEITFRFLSEPSDVNFGGKVHGGTVMKWIDQAAYACASNWCSGYCVTVYVGGIRFIQPIRIGEIVQVDARIILTGTSSMHIAVDVFSKPIDASKFIKTTHCIIVFVAVNDKGQPVPVPKWEPKTEDEKAHEHHAVKLMELRKNIDEEMQPFIYKNELMD
ncbi:acyl-CoA thioesterase [Hyphobacterium sp. CCMP332]|nr:acyl-CoA thioesterase [Hyphobacterium sp. CCMP332]